MRGIIVGLGGWGSSWVEIVRDSGWEIAAWVDTNPAALDNAVANLGANPETCFGNLEHAIERTQADAAFIFTPPMCGRAKDIIAAMDAGLHVLAEKPLAASLDDLRAILKRHERSPLKVMVAQNYRYFPSSALMREVGAGKLGRLGYMNVLYHMAESMPGHHMAELPDALALGMCVHHLDTMRFVIGADPETVWAETWNPPWSWSRGDACARAAFTFPGGVRVTYFAGWAAHRSETDWFGHWTLESENGSLFTDGVDSTLVSGDKEEKIAGARIDARHTRADSLREFTSAIEENRTPECSVEDNAKSLLMAFAAIESSRSRKEIDFSEFVGAQLGQLG